MNTSIFPGQLKPHAQAVQYSANLLENWLSQREREQRIRTKWSMSLIGVVTLAAAGIVGLVSAQAQTQAWADRETQALFKAKEEIQALGEAQKLKSADDQMKAIPEKYKERSEELLAGMIGSIAASDKSMGLTNLTFSREKGVLIGKGSAQVLDLRTARQYLDRVQTKLPGTQGLITNVTQSTDPNKLGLSIQFELQSSNVGGPR